MAKTIITQVIDDLDGSIEGVQTVAFSFDGTGYSIDLGPENLTTLEEALAPYLAAGRRVSGRAVRPTAPTSVDAHAVRAWAVGQGIEIAPRGRVARNVIEAFLAAA